MTSIEQLRETAQAAQHALWQAEANERDRLNRELIGRCFKYHNSGGGCEERWWLYLKVLRTEDGHLRAFTFEELPNGNIHIEPDYFKMAASLGKDGSYREITRAEFDTAWVNLHSKIKTFPL